MDERCGPGVDQPAGRSRLPGPLGAPGGPGWAAFQQQPLSTAGSGHRAHGSHGTVRGEWLLLLDLEQSPIPGALGSRRASCAVELSASRTGPLCQIDSTHAQYTHREVDPRKHIRLRRWSCGVRRTLFNRRWTCRARDAARAANSRWRDADTSRSGGLAYDGRVTRGRGGERRLRGLGPSERRRPQ